jgi:hypothetical protein
MTPKGIVLHNSASSFGDADQIDDWHKERGWTMIGYHAVILNGVRYGTKERRKYEIAIDGRVETGRDESRVGAHCLAGGMNSVALGVCCIGQPGSIIAEAEQAHVNLRQKPNWGYLTARQYHALTVWLAENCKQYGLDPLGKFQHPETGKWIAVISQHSDHDPVNKPQCASLNIPLIRSAVAALLMKPAPVPVAPIGWRVIGPDGKVLRDGVPVGEMGTGLVRAAVEAAGGSIQTVDARKEIHISGPTQKVVT